MGRSVSVVAATLLLLSVLPGIAHADPSPLLFVSPSSGPAGSHVTVTGTGWDPTYYGSGVHVGFYNNLGNGVLQSYAPEVVANPDLDGKIRLTAAVPTTALVNDVISFDALIGNGSGARANFVVTAAGRCAVTFIGLHGLTEDQTSTTIMGALTEFRTRMGQEQFTALSLPYPITHSDILSLIGFVSAGPNNPVTVGTKYLNDAIMSAESDCHPARVVLVGYSEGAWVIDRWLNDHAAVTERIIGVITYGDPQWEEPGTGASGIARNTAPSTAINPYRPAGALGFRFGGFCANGDPICGGGYPSTPHGRAQQKADAQSPQGLTAHGSYINGATTQGADWLLQLVRASEK